MSVYIVFSINISILYWGVKQSHDKGGNINKTIGRCDDQKRQYIKVSNVCLRLLLSSLSLKSCWLIWLHFIWGQTYLTALIKIQRAESHVIRW